MDFGYPSVIRQELRQQRPIAAQVSVGNFGVVGFFPKGPTNQAVLVRGSAEHYRIFGEFTPKSISPLITKAYFENGGQNLVVVRVVGAGAIPSQAGFSIERRDEAQSVTSNAIPTPFSTTLGGLYPLRPGSVSIFLNDQLGQVAEAVGAITVSTGPYTFRVAPGRYVIPGSMVLTYPDATPGTVSLTDDGAGNLVDTTEVATIDYFTGVITLNALINPAAGNVTVDYSYRLGTAYPNEKVLDEIPGAVIYYGQLNNRHAHDQSITFKWTSGSVAQTATVAGSVISGDADGTINLVTGEFDIDFGANVPDTGTDVLCDYFALSMSEAVDDGDGAVTGSILTAPGTVDYETGEIDVILAATVADAQTFYASFDMVIHPAEVRWEGEAGDNFTMRLTRDANSINSVTGLYDFFIFELLEQSGNVTNVVGNFSRISLGDISNARFLAQQVNDEFSGSATVKFVPDFTAATPTGLEGSLKSNVKLLTTDGLTNPPVVCQLPLSGGEIVPGTLQVTYTDTTGQAYTLVDDAQGGFLQDAVTGTGLSTSVSSSVNYQTGLVNLALSDVPRAVPDVLAAYTLTSPEASVTAAFTGGADGAALTRADVTGPLLELDEKGIFALNGFDDLLHFSIPDLAGDVDAARAALGYLGNREDGQFIFSTPDGLTPTTAASWKRFALQSNNERGAVYWPWIFVEDPLTGLTVRIPPDGHVGGVISTVDRQRNVGKAPAGVRDGALQGLRGLTFQLKPEGLTTLFAASVNALWAPPRQTNCVWGARTLDSTGGEYVYINKRRSMDAISIQVNRSMWWAVFESSGPQLFSEIERTTRGILNSYFKQGVLAGATPDEAFFVICDQTNNTPDTIASGFVFLDYGVALNTPGEFIVTRHRQILANT